jgi:quercetin dioxygenase-like cupin family protein
MVAIQCRKTLVQTDGVRVAEFEMAPHAEGDVHRHSSMSEFCICLRGQLELRLGGGSARCMAPGDSVEIPAGVEHQLVNAGTVACRYLVVQHGGEYDYVTLAAAP